MQIVQQLLKQDPKYVPALKLKGMLLEDTGDMNQAGAVFEAALKLAPHDGDLLTNAGIYKLASGEKEEALALLTKANKLRPGDSEIQYYLAQAYHLNGKDQLAIGAIRMSLKADPRNASIQQKYGELLSSAGNYREGLRWLLQAQHSDKDLPRLDYEIGAADFKLMDLAGAEQILQHAVEAEPEDRNALELLASTQTKLAHWEGARESFTGLLRQKAKDPDALLGLGQCELELHDYPASARSLQEALRIDPTKLQAHFYLSRVYSAMGRTSDAQHEAALHHLMMEQMSFVRSLETEQREDGIRSQARDMLKNHHEDNALKLYQDHFKGTLSGKGDAYVFIGKIYLFMGKSDDGVRCFQHALELDPRVRGAHTYQGILDLKLGDLDRAENEFRAELANDPSYQVAIAEIGEVRYHQRKWDEAAAWLEKSKTMTPEFLYMLCDADFHLGKVQDADLVAESAAAYGAGSREFMQSLLTLLSQNGQSDLARTIALQLP